MTSRKFNFWLKDQIDQEFLESQKNISDFLRNLIVIARTGNSTDLSENELKKQKMIADIEYKKILTAIKKREYEFHENFGKSPSSQGKIAIKTAVNNESFIPPEEKNLEKLIENNWDKFLLSLRTNKNNEWIANCRLCDTGFILPTKEQSIQRFKDHLSENHDQELLKI
jgi:hypothetical protein